VKLVSLILASTVLDFTAGRVMARSTRPKHRRIALVASCVGNLGLLSIFKYANFFVDSFEDLVSMFGLTLSPVELNIVLPVGISFYTFQTLSYTIDLYRRKVEPCRDFLDFALFVAFFPQLVAGPIVRAKHFLPQLSAPHPWVWSRLRSGLWLMLVGLAKKVVIADTLALTVDRVFAAPDQFGCFQTWVGVTAFAFQIYADFSGYSDVAIGAARILGFDIPENFRHPYLARSIREFWQRWHISLSTWLRDYLYIPLGGSRGSLEKTYRNLMTTMILGGLWHGASWTFVAWGLYQGVWLCANRMYNATAPRLDGVPAPGALTRGVQTLATFVVVCFGWVLFRAETFHDALTTTMTMLGLGSTGQSTPLRLSVLWIMGLVVVTHVLAGFRERGQFDWTRPLFVRAVVITGCVLGIVAFSRPNPSAFIYFQF
jgi:D-alanyl-lipoteichoic acid acyltransferase DltB (MBOAT superfamily)